MNIRKDSQRRSGRAFKEAVYDQIARAGQALSSGPRLELLELLCQAPRTVEALAAEVGQPVANTSHHLRVLHRARLVTVQSEGVHRRYRVADEVVERAYLTLRELAQARLPELAEAVNAFDAGSEDWEPVDAAVLIERARAGRVTVLDVRPAPEYRAGHLPGARSIPIGELERRIAELPRARDVVAYCRGPYCVYAAEAVALLRARGFNAQRLAEGVPDWRARGLPIERSTEC